MKISFRKSVGVLAMLLIGVASVNAQSEAQLKQHFEGRQVTVKIDMPATKDGINIYPFRTQKIDYDEYANRINRHGTSIREGESVMVTKVKVSGNHIEFHLGGGGYGTFFDESRSPEYVSPAQKSRREKELDRQIKETTDERERKRLKNKRDDLRRQREEKDERNRELSELRNEQRRERVERKALSAGSRFNIHLDRSIESNDLTPEFIIEALEKYLTFN
jgi:hypothetical protein